MRRPELSSSPEAALSFLARAEVIHLASTSPAGEPVLRTLNAALLGDRLLFHGAKAGEKALCVGRRAVASADEVIASVPSYFSDPELACPATTYYESVQVHGTLEQIDDVALKARMLSALMHKHQPEGGYAPIDGDDPRYAGRLRGVLVFGLRIEEVTGKSNFGQHKTDAQRLAIVEALWARGAATDARAIQRVFEASPSMPRPPRFVGVDGSVLEPALDQRSVEAAVTLLADEYWNLRYEHSRLARCHLNSPAWIGARAPNGDLIATARAISDGAKQAVVMDVAIRRDWRRRGLGQRLIALLLEHPAVRGTHVVRLGTADAQSFYAKLGFREKVDFGFSATAMTLLRDIPTRGTP
jgi:nitroimidazol reductase NimA-like FMN-containing flavoprotein (pyridoxamine 5'-phosphate oxidase superfamily)/GNAT superfamily N-acetyltransferase